MSEDMFNLPPTNTSMFEDIPSSLPAREGNDIYATLGAVATSVQSGQGDHEATFRAYLQSRSSNQALLSAGQAPRVFDEAAQQDQIDLITQAIETEPSALDAVIQSTLNVNSQDATAGAGFESLEAVKRASSPQETKAADDVELGGWFLRKRRNEQIIADVANAYIERQQGAYQNGARDFVNGAVDLIHSVLPLTVSASRVSGRAPDDERVGLWDKIFPSGEQRRQIVDIWGATDEETRANAEAYFANLDTYDKSFLGLLPQENEMERIQRARDLMSGIDPEGAEALAFVDNIPLVGAVWGLGRKGTSRGLLALSRQTGADSLHNKILSDALSGSDEATTRAAAQNVGEEVDGVVDELAPTSLSPDPSNNAKLGNPAIEAANIAQAALRFLRLDRVKLSRLTAAERQDAVEAATDQAKKSLGTARILDVSVETVDLGTTSAPRLAVTVGEELSEEALEEGLEAGAREVLPESARVERFEPLTGTRAADDPVGAADDLQQYAGDLNADKYDDLIEDMDVLIDEAGSRSGVDKARYIIEDLQNRADFLRNSSDPEDIAVASKIDELIGPEAQRLDQGVWRPDDEVLGPPKPEVVLGSPEGTHFATRDDAVRFVDEQGFDSNVGVDFIQNSEHGGWAAVVRLPVPEEGFYTPIKSINNRLGWISRAVLGNRQLLDEDLLGFAQRGEGLKDRLQKVLDKHISRPWKALRGDERRATMDVISRGGQENVWYSRQEFKDLFSRQNPQGDADRAYDAYLSFRQANDIEYTLHNDAMFRQLSSEGHETVSTHGIHRLDGTNAVVREFETAAPSGHFVDLSGGRSYWDGNPLGKTPTQLREEGYVMLKFPETVEVMIDGSPVRVTQAIVKKTDLARRPLDRFQLPYKAGGHRMYDPSYRKWVKQARSFKQGDTGTETFISPRTFTAGRTTGELSGWVKAQNRALATIRAGRKEGLTDAELTVRLSDDISDPKSFLDDVNNDRISLDYDFEIVENRQLPSQYIKSDYQRGFMDSDQVSHASSHGRLATNSKGEHLKTVTGQDIPILDPMDTTSKALGKIADMTGLNEYRHRAVNQWLARYGKYHTVGKGDPLSQFANATIDPNAPLAIQRAAKQARDALMRTLGTSTEADRAARRATAGLLDAMDRVAGKSKIWQKMAPAANWMFSTSFTQKLKGIAFDLYLGLGDVGQFPLQVQTALAAATIDPINGMKAWGALPFVRAYVTGIKKTDPSEFLKLVGKDFFGHESGEDMVRMMDSLRDSGWLDFGGSQMLIGDMSSSTTMKGGIGSQLEAGRQLGRQPFKESERWNRIIAYQMSWLRQSKKFADLKKSDPEAFMNKVAQGADDLAMNMTNASSAAFQHTGIVDVATQFWAYQNRMLEALGGKQFTATEKLRLATGQVLLYGTAGLPVLATWERMNREAERKAGGEGIPDPSTFEGALRRGFFDTMAYMATQGEADLAFGEKAGIGNFHVEQIKTWFEMIPMVEDIGYKSRELTVTEAIGGAGLAATIGLAGTSTRVIEGAMASMGLLENTAPLTRQDLVTLANNISSFSDAHKAWVVYSLGELHSKGGLKLAEDLNAYDALATLIGVNPAVAARAQIDFSIAGRESDYIKDNVKAGTPLYQAMMQAQGDNDFRARAEEFNLFMQSISNPRLKLKIQQDIVRNGGDAMYNSLNETIRERAVTDQVVQNISSRRSEDQD